MDDKHTFVCRGSIGAVEQVVILYSEKQFESDTGSYLIGEGGYIKEYRSQWENSCNNGAADALRRRPRTMVHMHRECYFLMT